MLPSKSNEVIVDYITFNESVSHKSIAVWKDNDAEEIAIPDPRLMGAALDDLKKYCNGT
ncbi:hypothetical protein HK098_000659, partial [Nowakowskiella sp. JEL0407]